MQTMQEQWMDRSFFSNEQIVVLQDCSSLHIEFEHVTEEVFRCYIGGKLCR